MLLSKLERTWVSVLLLRALSLTSSRYVTLPLLSTLCACTLLAYAIFPFVGHRMLRGQCIECPSPAQYDDGWTLGQALESSANEQWLL